MAQLEDACRRGGATLHGTGINPGGITERFPLMLSSLCRDIRHVRVEEFSDIRNYPTASVVREVMLFGTPPEQAATSPMPEILGDGFGQSIDMVAAGLGWKLDPEKRTTHEMAVARRDLDTPVGVLRRRHGRGAALHVGGSRRRRAGDHGAGELAHGRGRSRARLATRTASGSRSSSTRSLRSR